MSMMGGGKKVKPHVQAALDAAREKARRAAIVPIQDEGNIKAAGQATRKGRRGRSSTLLSRAGGDDTLGS